MRKHFRIVLGVGLTLAICFVPAIKAYAFPAGLTVTEIANSGGALGYSNFSWAALNENGVVCYKGADVSRSAILKGNGTQRQVLASSESASGLFDQFPTGICSINDVGDVAFDSCKNCSPSLPGGALATATAPLLSSTAAAIQYSVYVYRENAAILTKVRETGAGPSDYLSVALPTINNAGDVSFNGELNNGFKGIWLWNSGVLTSPSVNSLGLFSEFGGAILNDSQMLAFGATESATPNYRGIYGPSGNRLVGTFNGFAKVSLPAINNAGQIAALAIHTATPGSTPENGVYIDGAPFITNSGDFAQVDISSFQGVSINDNGDVIFPAFRPNGNAVAFLAVKGGMLPIVEEGDFIPGYASAVSFVTTGRESINNARQIALVVGLQDGTQLVLRLDPNGIVFPDDHCPLDNTKYDAGVCGCGVSDIDSNGDGVLDCLVTGTARQLAQSLYKNVRKLKRLPVRASKKNKAALKQLTREVSRITNQLYSMVKGSQAQVKVTSKKKTPLSLVSAIRSKARQAVKTTQSSFKLSKSQTLAAIKQFLKILAA